MFPCLNVTLHTTCSPTALYSLREREDLTAYGVRMGGASCFFFCLRLPSSRTLFVPVGRTHHRGGYYLPSKPETFPSTPLTFSVLSLRRLWHIYVCVDMFERSRRTICGCGRGRRRTIIGTGGVRRSSSVRIHSTCCQVQMCVDVDVQCDCVVIGTGRLSRVSRLPAFTKGTNSRIMRWRYSSIHGWKSFSNPPSFSILNIDLVYLLHVHENTL